MFFSLASKVSPPPSSPHPLSSVPHVWFCMPVSFVTRASTCVAAARGNISMHLALCVLLSFVPDFVQLSNLAFLHVYLLYIYTFVFFLPLPNHCACIKRFWSSSELGVVVVKKVLVVVRIGCRRRQSSCKKRIRVQSCFF